MNYRYKHSSKKAVCGISATVLASLVALTGLTFGATANAATFKVNKTHDEYVKASTELNAQIMQEGMVLLKNKDNALPLAKGSSVSVLGVGSYNTLWGETGGGNGKSDYTYISDSLTSAGFTVKSYKDAYSSAKQVTLAGAKVYLEPEVSTLGTISGDTAIVTLSRSGKESNDNLKAGDTLVSNGWAAGDHQLMLNTNEKALIEAVKQNCSKVIVLLNTPTVMQIPELEADAGIDAIMYIGMPGQYGLDALGGVLNGTVSPSGRTVATWASDFTKDPTYANFGDATGIIKDDAGNDVNTLEYEEGIYVGYKYYETAAAEAAKDNYAGFNYDNAVVYPFGYGLSYTTFTQTIKTESVDLSDKAFDDYIEVKVEVKNTGSVAGKEVVQIYSHAPYTAGEIEKSEVVLAGFAKTSELKAGESETVTVQIRVGDIASFDYNDANHDGWYGYEIESGAYELRLQKNSHEVIDTLDYNVSETLAFNNDGSKATLSGTDNKENLVFSNGDDFDSLYLMTAENGGDFKVMTRSNFTGTFPTAPAGTGSYTDKVNTKYASEFTPDKDTASDPWYVESVPENWTQGANTSYTLFDMAGIDYTSTETLTEGKFEGKTGVEAWTEFMNQLTWDEIKSIPEKGSHLTVAVQSIGKPQQADTDGPEQLGDGTFWACANIIAGTWNVQLCEERGIALGNEGLYDGFVGWYGPTANINRSPLGGRNNIYFSEDSLLAGKISAANVKGAQSRGIIAYVKHFALNEQETNRTGLATFVTEQALRETYLKSFEYTVKEGEALGMMQAMNRVGGVNCYGNYALDVTVLRDEWGFKGGVVTDSYNSSLVRENMSQRMGGDFPLGTFSAEFAGTWDASKNTVTYNGTASPTQWSAIRNAAMHVLYMSANSSQLANGYDLSELIAKSLTLTLGVGEIEPVNASIDTAKFGTSNVAYSATGLPEGLSIDSKTGIISGTTKEAGDYNAKITVTVTEEGEEWISYTYLAKVTVEGKAGGSGCSGCSSTVAVGTSLALMGLGVAGIAVALVIRSKKSSEN